MTDKELVSEFKEYIKHAFRCEYTLVDLIYKDNISSPDHDYVYYFYGQLHQLEICMHELDELIFKFWRDKGEII